MTSIPSPLSFLDAVTGVVEAGRTSSADRPVKLAVVDPAYNPFLGYPAATPAVRVTFEGETVLSAKAYPLAQGFIPRPGQRVWMVPQGNGYLVAGAVNAQTPQGFWQDADGVDAGVELGGGNYFDTTEGLYLETDATVAGDVQGANFVHAARSLRVPEMQADSVSITKGTAASAQTQAITWPVAWPVGTPVYCFTNIPSSAGGTGSLMTRAQAVTNVGCTIVVLKTDAALANFTLSAFPVSWLAVAYPVA